MAHKEEVLVKLIVGLKKEVFYEKKSLLVSMSPFFKRMLEGHMNCTERETHTITLPNIHPNTFGELINFAFLRGMTDGRKLNEHIRSLPGATPLPAADQSDDEAAKTGLLHLWVACNYLGMDNYADLLFNRIMEHFDSPPLGPPSKALPIVPTPPHFPDSPLPSPTPTPRSPLDVADDGYPTEFPSLPAHTYASQPARPPSQPAPPPSHPTIGGGSEALHLAGVLALVLREKPALKNDKAIKNKVVGWVVYETVMEGCTGQGAGQGAGKVQKLMGEMPAAWWQTVIDRLDDARDDISRRIGFLHCELERPGCDRRQPPGTRIGPVADRKKLQIEREERRLAAVREIVRVLQQQGGPAAGDA
ncbi:unnamed protein product [Vitrella brassicaformis CCMP3155]|uniref:BTB domain-containing protein n=1 Tax=Vitrella brassicaformis (strain CCMP3155) TaxID=1169540 RepID=A0A0G4FMX2_VITBC|nr:unnamed protein product [Vitrella brassicaformis CCMP3155]|eukprot:CEM14930.1 unnamed protein product [Vitrella brassicaformis CCMP3155]